MSQSNKKNAKIVGLGIIILVAVVGLLVAKMMVESKIKAWAKEDLTLYEPFLKLESAKVGASFLGASVTYSDVVYTIPELDGITLRVGKISENGIDRDTLMGKAGDLTTIDKIVVEKLGVFVEGFELPIMEIGRYEMNDLEFNYRDTRAMLLENRGNDDIMEFLGNILRIASEYPTKSGADKAENLRINLKQADFADISIGLISSSGMQELNRNDSGFDMGIEQILYKDIFMDCQLDYSTSFNLSLDSVRMKGLKANYHDLFEALVNFSEDNDPFTLMAGVIPSLYNYEFDEVVAENFVLTVPDVNAVFKMASMRLGPHSLREQGPHSISKIGLTFGGMEVFTIDEIGLEKFVMPEMVVDFILDPAPYLDDMGFLFEVMEDPAAVMDGLRLENVYLKNLNANGMVSLNSWRGDLWMDDQVHISSKLGALHVSPIAMRQMGMMMYGMGGGSEILGILAERPDGLTLDNTFSLTMDVASDYLDFDLDFELALRQLGSLAFKMEGTTDEPAYWETYGDPMLYSLDLTFKDQGLLNIFYTYMASEGFAPSADAVRRSLLAELDEKMEEVAGKQARLLTSLRSFLDQGGTLNISFSSDEPVLLDDIDPDSLLEDPALTIRHTPN